MDSDWEKFTSHLNQVIETKIAPVEQELNSQDELLKKLSITISHISEAMQSKYGRLPPPEEAEKIDTEKTENNETNGSPDQ